MKASTAWSWLKGYVTLSVVEGRHNPLTTHQNNMHTPFDFAQDDSSRTRPIPTFFKFEAFRF